jgi:hypothetical protein
MASCGGGKAIQTFDYFDKLKPDQMKLTSLKILTFLISTTVVFSGACRTSGGSGGFEILGPADETPEAGRLVQEANTN